YPTWLIDDDALCHRLFFWLQAQYGITGFVYSQAHGWSDDPYRDVRSFAGSNGDGLLIYPGDPFGASQPFPSLRLQVLRDGLEDYELLWLLRQEVRGMVAAMGGGQDAEEWAEETVRSHCRRLASSLRCFTRRPADLLHARREVMEEILAARRRPRLAAVWEGNAVEERRLRLAVEPGSRVTVNGTCVTGAREFTVRRVAMPAGAAVQPVLVAAQLAGETHLLRRWPPWPAEPPPPMPRLEVPRPERPPRLDGRIDPGEWEGAAAVRLPHLASGMGRARAITECFLLHDGARLYFAARCYLGGTASAPDEQAVTLWLDPPPRGDARLILTLTGAGRRYATLRSREGHTIPRLEWEWAHQAGEGVWECETALALPPGAFAGEWGVEVTRQAGAEESAWALSYGDIRRFGRMRLRTPEAKSSQRPWGRPQLTTFWGHA
ncbi:MAG: DUF4091 domain-containing protein, partial [Armatimonadota bacterium]|nr:DUF4091 domain-containing protein [Armatimonadota bacterium]